MGSLSSLRRPLPEAIARAALRSRLPPPPTHVLEEGASHAHEQIGLSHDHLGLPHDQNGHAHDRLGPSKSVRVFRRTNLVFPKTKVLFRMGDWVMRMTVWVCRMTNLVMRMTAPLFPRTSGVLYRINLVFPKTVPVFRPLNQVFCHPTLDDFTFKLECRRALRPKRSAIAGECSARSHRQGRADGARAGALADAAGGAGADHRQDGGGGGDFAGDGGAGARLIAPSLGQGAFTCFHTSSRRGDFSPGSWRYSRRARTSAGG